jgi:dephospho-CoA kinase
MQAKKRPSQKPKPSLLAIVGMPGAGKGEAARVAKRMGFPVITFGDVIRDEAKKRGLPLTSESMAEVADWFHSGRGPLMVKRLLAKIPKSAYKRNFIVLDGPRSPGQIRLLKKIFDVKVLAIFLPDKMRWKRQLSRGRPDLGTLADVKARDKRELSYGLGKVIKAADWRVSSDCSLPEFRGRAAAFFKVFRKFAQSI